MFSGGDAYLLSGRSGNDPLRGGNAEDTFVFQAGHHRDMITDLGDGGDVDVVRSVVSATEAALFRPSFDATT